MKIKISRDVYDISNRVKDIDRDYYIVYDTILEKFEVHNSAQLGSSYCLTLPYDELDVRVLSYVRRTQVSNIDDIIASIDRENDYIDRTSTHEAVDTVLEYLEEEGHK